MQNVQEINFYGSIYGEISRLARRNFEASLYYYERDLGYESGNESNIEIINIPNKRQQSRLVLRTNSEIEADDGIENE